jgi:chromosome segregation ATPase
LGHKDPVALKYRRLLEQVEANMQRRKPEVLRALRRERAEALRTDIAFLERRVESLQKQEDSLREEIEQLERRVKPSPSSKGAEALADRLDRLEEKLERLIRALEKKK